ncbi:MAG: hypothetical protein E7525_01135 [Ruminococcaceae bacterium]|nr:hypothetical protein [Oscillospiraceae bacterium]
MKFEFLKKFRKLFDNKKFLVAFSVVIAVVFWLVIEIGENPSRDITLSDVPVTLIEKQDDNNNKLVPVGQYSDNVTVIVSGPGYIVGTVSKDDVTVSVKSYKDVEKTGVYTLTLEASVNKSGCTAVPSPNFIQVKYDYIMEADIPVEVDVSEFKFTTVTDRKIGRSILKSEADGAELTTLKISGPSEVVSSVARVVVKPLQGLQPFAEETVNYDSYEATFYDHAGNPIADSSQLVYNTDTYVRVVVYKTAEVGLKPTFTNLPQYYVDNGGLPKFSLSVFNETTNKFEAIDSVTVQGPVETVQALLDNGLSLAPIDFSKVTPGNTKFNVSFVLGDGVTVVDGTEEITVSLDVGSLKQKSFTIDPSKIQFYNLNGGMTATTSYKKGITVTLCGRYAVLSKVKAEDIQLSVDCADIATASVNTKTLTVKLKGSVEAWAVSINPVDINVTVN